ncbi:pyridoxamine 5'-phosphate oxidase family protein [Ferruginibacter sp.]|nr:pyridoxamine 5'-phosphate oxidase family protein [Ferruginibacter sp.]
MLGLLNEVQINNILTSQAIGRLACTDGEQPYIVPLTFAYDGDYIYGQTNEGLKLEMLRKNPHVCFEVDVMSDMRNWQSVIIKGEFEELKDVQEQEAREILFRHVFPLLTSSTINPYGHQVTDSIDDSNRVKNVMYRIGIKEKTGRFEKQ